jgi:hypothetical protein
LRADFLDEAVVVAPKPGPKSSETCSIARGADVLAGEATTQQLGEASRKMEFADVAVNRDSWPAFGEHRAAVPIDFAEGDGAHSCSLKSERKSADAAEEIEDIHSVPR